MTLREKLERLGDTTIEMLVAKLIGYFKSGR